MVVGFLLIGGLQFPNDLCNVDQLVVVFYLETKNPVKPPCGVPLVAPMVFRYQTFIYTTLSDMKTEVFGLN